LVLAGIVVRGQYLPTHIRVIRRQCDLALRDMSTDTEGDEPDRIAAEEAGEGIGEDVDRVEDRRLLTGEAAYTDDLDVPGAGHMAVVRSQYASAEIEEVDTGPAEAMEEVAAVITAETIEASDLPTPSRIPIIPGPGIETDERLNRPIIAEDVVRHQGEPIAVVIAEDRYAARDAVAAVDVTYDRRDAVVDPEEAVADDAPAVHEATPDNVAFEYEFGDREEMDRICEEANHTVSIEIGNQRIVQNPMEPRAAVAEFDPGTETLTVRSTTQIPHKLRRDISKTLDYPASKIDVVAPEMGGGFGSRCVPYPEEMLIAWTSMYLQRPVRWQGTRTGNYASDVQGRGVITEGTLAVDDDGHIQGLAIDLLDDMGAYLSAFAPGIAVTCTNVMTGQYDIPEVYYSATGTMTNATPSDAYRGVVETEMIHTLERLVDRAAREVGLDPAELRRRNFVPADAFPYETAAGATYDSGDYEPALEKALDLADYDELRERQAQLREEGRYLGIGLAAWIEKCGFGCGGAVPSWEYSNVQFHPSGEVVVETGTSNHGQGHETTYAQVAADKLGVPLEDIRIVEDDTTRVQEGVGTFASRCALTAGGSINESAEKIIEKGRELAAHRLEADTEDVVFEDGEFHVAGVPGRSLSIQEIAADAHVGYELPEGMEPGLEATSYFDPDDYSFPFGIQIAVVEVDPASGETEFEDFVSVDDCGVQINPKIVEGQVHGGTAQGIGQALYEGAEYDDTGTLVTGSHQDYTVPKAEHVPEMVTAETVTPSPRNPLGVKGVGESGAIGGLAATVNAVHDALSPFDVEPMTPPLTEETVWSAVRAAREE
jgi:carbon-monoxide dehydrogenase large subunit